MCLPWHAESFCRLPAPPSAPPCMAASTRHLVDLCGLRRSRRLVAQWSPKAIGRACSPAHVSTSTEEVAATRPTIMPALVNARPSAALLGLRAVAEKTGESRRGPVPAASSPVCPNVLHNTTEPITDHGVPRLEPCSGVPTTTTRASPRMHRGLACQRKKPHGEASF